MENRANKWIDCYQRGELCDVTLVAGIDNTKSPVCTDTCFYINYSLVKLFDLMSSHYSVGNKH